MDRVDVDDLLSRLREIEELLQFPGVAGHVERAEKLAISIARSARTGAIAQLAMQAVSEAHALKASVGAQDGDALPLAPSRRNLERVLGRLRESLEQARAGA